MPDDGIGCASVPILILYQAHSVIVLTMEGFGIIACRWAFRLLGPRSE
jgi:ABC-type thiamin/hydroxymethylpyrimidine transport system permease subunit